MFLAADCPQGHEELPMFGKEVYLRGFDCEAYFEEDSGQPLPVDEVRAGVDLEIDLMQTSFVFEGARRDTAQSRVWATRWCHCCKGQDTVRSCFVARQCRPRRHHILFARPRAATRPAAPL